MTSKPFHGFVATPTHRDWIEDFDHENGQYQNVCTTCECVFIGHKRRVTCKACAFSELEAAKDRWRLALESLTPGGSEFVNDVDYCLNYILEQRLREHIRFTSAVKENHKLAAEVARLLGLINTPHTHEWLEAVPLEAAHQIERWGTGHDDGKTPFDWFWLIGYLAQKAATSAVAGDIEKAKHHTISTGACLLNWFRRLTGDDSSFQPGISTPTPQSIDEVLNQ